MTSEIKHQVEIPPLQKKQRLDAVLASLLPQYSRSRIQLWLDAGQVLLNGKPASRKVAVRGGESVLIAAVLVEQQKWQAQAIALHTVAATADYIVVNKPAGLVVHPAAGNPDNTLVNALLHHYPELDELPRVGIIHRLDKNTSGLLVVARNVQAHAHLVRQLQARTVSRQYQAIVNGVIVSGATVRAAIGRHPVARKKMAVVAKGKEAITHYRVGQRFAKHTAVHVQLETGRTHQIRVHMAYLGYPLVGDTTHGARVLLPKAASAELSTCLQQFKRQALHAAALAFVDPGTDEKVSFSAELPQDMQTLLHLLQQHEQ